MSHCQLKFNSISDLSGLYQTYINEKPNLTQEQKLQYSKVIEKCLKQLDLQSSKIDKSQYYPIFMQFLDTEFRNSGNYQLAKELTDFFRSYINEYKLLINLIQAKRLT